MKKLLFIFIVIYTFKANSQSTYSNSVNKHDTMKSGNSCEMNEVNISPFINFRDTLRLINVADINNKDSLSEKSMPWIVALVIGLLSVLVNFWVAHRLRESNERNLKKQIDSAKEITITQFKGNIGAKNRQDWINEIRETLSEYLTYIHKVTPDFKVSVEDSKKYFEKIYYTKFKLELMLNPGKKEQNDLIEAVDNMVDIIRKSKEEYTTNDIISARDHCVQSARKLFEIHWNKIKELE